MRTWIVIALAVGALACGGGEKAEDAAAAAGDAAEAAGKAMGSAAEDAKEALGSAAQGAKDALSDVASTGAEGLTAEESAQGCMNLISQKEYGKAVPVCMQAVQKNPGNEELTGALEHAKQQASAEAAGAMGEGAKAMGDELKQGQDAMQGMKAPSPPGMGDTN